MCDLWDVFRKFSLTANHRLSEEDAAHAKWLIELGNGSLTNDTGLPADFIKIPTDMISTNIIDDIFPQRIRVNMVRDLQDHAILCPTNMACHELNMKIIDRIEGPLKSYYSVDSVCSDDDNANLFPMEFLHTLAPSGMPPHDLKLKVGTIVILLRNLDGRYVHI